MKTRKIETKIVMLVVLALSGSTLVAEADEIAIFNRAFSVQEIRHIYQGDLPAVIGFEIVGPGEVAENFSASYRTIAYYDDESTKDVTDSAFWSVEPEAIAGIESGVLTTKDITRDEAATIWATYTRGNVTFEAEKVVHVFGICPTGTALSFDGVDDYVDCGNDSSLDITDSITVEAWVKRPNFETNGVIAGKTNGNSVTAGYGLFSYIDGLEFSFYSRGWRRTMPRLTITPNEWHYVVGTFGGNTAYLYVNGEQKASVAYVGTIAAATGYSFHISFWRSRLRQHFNGTIDEVAIYNRSLSGEEIRANMHWRLAGDEPGLVGYWDFDKGLGQIVCDLSGNGNDGLLGSTPDVDASDPAWIESDAPIGFCTHLIATGAIKVALKQKKASLEKMEAALAEEWTAYQALEELLKNGDYVDMKKSDIIHAMQQIRFSIQHEKLSAKALQKSIKKLKDSLSVLDYETECLMP